MKVLTEEDARELLNGESLDSFISQLSNRLELLGGTRWTPVNSGRQIALARLFAYLVKGDSRICLYVTDWSIGTEVLDLFYGYRRSIGEGRLLIDAPVHLFDRADEEALVSLLSMVFFFSWDASVFDLAGRMLLRTSHGGWLEVRGSGDKAIAEALFELERLQLPAWGS
jgi:hypothetical protein